ncbi:hypothetical protein ABT095_03660 [Kitasatospora sp. NPDC002227]|uniref:hypothetical protein n=1 Tax=Kitasatospora sp. NPDC002227 TaxID=3154773 RepID=UPI00331DBB11
MRISAARFRGFLAGVWQRRRWRRSILAALCVLALLVLPVAAAGVALRLQYAGAPSADAWTRGRDAVWLGHAWVDGRKGEPELTALTRQLAGTGVRDLYVHTGPLESDGSLSPARYPKAAWLLAAVHRELPGVRVQAWLGNVVAPEHPEALHLEDPASRERVVTATRQVLAAGFEGVHFDMEPIRSDSAGFLTLLDRTHAVTAAAGAPLSVAAPQIDPLPGLHVVTTGLTDHGKWWSQAYFGQVARRVEQIAVMSYDTSMQLESLYGGYVAQQTKLALEATPPGVDLLMGLPGYWDDTFSHRGSAETVAAAVRGARLGLSRHGGGRRTFGLALYADFSASAQDWSSFRDGWTSR